MVRKSPRFSAVLLAFSLCVWSACKKDAILNPGNTPSLDALAKKGADSAGLVVHAFDAPSNVYTITLGAGDVIDITVVSSECSGDPEGVNVTGLISAPSVLAGTCNPGGSLNGQTARLGPASTNGTVSFSATHQVFGPGPAAPITGPDSNNTYTAYLDDGAGSPDFNDVILSIKVSNTDPKLACTETVVRGESVSCSVSGQGVTVTQWSFNAASSQGGGPATVVGPTFGNEWAGTAVLAGTVVAKVSVNGTPRSDSLTKAFAVTARPWRWQQATQWSYARTAGQCTHNDPYQYRDGSVLGWSVRKGSCDPLPITPRPGIDVYNGYTVDRIGFGPNEGVWYVTSLSYRMDTESNIASSIRAGSPPFYALTNSKDLTACKKAKLTSVDFFSYNQSCQKVDPVAFQNGIWNHEGRGTGMLNGHQAQLELYAITLSGDIYRNLEGLIGTNEPQLRLDVNNKGVEVNAYLNGAWASHTNVNNNYCGSLWMWRPATSQFVLDGANQAAGQCF